MRMRATSVGVCVDGDAEGSADASRRRPRGRIIGALPGSPWGVRAQRRQSGRAAAARGRPVHLSARSLGRKPFADSYAEAAGVCLDRHHRSPTDFDLDRSGTRSGAVVAWQPPDARTRGAWANETDATEAGASACALAAVELTDGLVAVRRAETGTGADYYVAPPGASPDDLEDCLRLEVSGVDRGPEPVVRQRLNAKLRQAAAGNSNLPALAGVVGFKARLIAVAELQG